MPYTRDGENRNRPNRPRGGRAERPQPAFPGNGYVSPGGAVTGHPGVGYRPNDGMQHAAMPAGMGRTNPGGRTFQDRGVAPMSGATPGMPGLQAIPTLGGGFGGVPPEILEAAAQGVIGGPGPMNQGMRGHGVGPGNMLFANQMPMPANGQPTMRNAMGETDKGRLGAPGMPPTPAGPTSAAPGLTPLQQALQRQALNRQIMVRRNAMQPQTGMDVPVRGGGGPNPWTPGLPQVSTPFPDVTNQQRTNPAYGPVRPDFENG